MTEYTWPEAARNDKAFGSRIQDEKRQRLVDLVELIEMNLNVAWNSTSAYAREQCASLATYYAKEFQKRTGFYYTRTPSLQKTIVRGKK